MTQSKNIRTSLNAQAFIGQTFGLLTVLDNANELTGDRRKWRCLCVCGAITQSLANGVKHGRVKSCGHLRGAPLKGKSRNWKRTPEYHSWDAMIQRCANPNSTGFDYYGGRGITVCERWCKSFAMFLQDMGVKPTPAHSLDRYPDKNGNYEPSNCRWATKREQGQNTRKNRYITYGDETHCIAEWARKLGLFPQVMERRFNEWTIERAITTPLLSRYSHPKAPRV